MTSRHYDIVLVLDYFRTASAYLSIIKYLSSRSSIGLYVTDGDPQSLRKNRTAHRLFVNECLRLGARAVDADERTEAGVLLVQQRPYTDQVAARIQNAVKARRRIGLLTLATMGVPSHDIFIDQFRLEKLYGPNLRLLRFLLARRNAERAYADVDIEQVGLPFARYPVYPEFETDYIIAAPTLFSFKDEEQKQAFLENALKLIAQMDPHDQVVYKPHNGTYWDYLAPHRYRVLSSLLASIPAGFTGRLPWEWRARLRTAELHRRLQRRALPLRRLTPYAAFGLELFLPGVRKGVIGGLSNTIWSTLFFGKSFFNCVDEQRRAASREDKLLPHKDGRHLLDLNLEFFRVPYCHGTLSAGADGSGIILAEDREGDLIAALSKDINAAAGA